MEKLNKLTQMLNSLTFRGCKLYKFSKIIGLLTLLFIISCNQGANSDPYSDVPLDEKIGQMLMIGFRGLTVDDSEHIRRDIEKHQIGGVVLYSLDLPSDRTLPRNIESPQQLQQLNNDLQALSKTPLFISIDQEGGRVCRLTPKYEFPERPPSAQYLGDLNNLDSTRYFAAQTAKTLKDAGINLNYAPAVDVNVNPECPVIGGIERSISADPKIVTAHATEIINEHKKYGIYCSLKHFPGHGSANMDSHFGFTDVTDTWSEMELEPYKALIDNNNVDVIMTAHVFNSKLDDQYPATLSKKTTHDILREKYQWNGVIISDDLHMGAIADKFDFKTTIEKSIEAGVDILIFSNNSKKVGYDTEVIPKAMATIKTLIKEGKITQTQISKAYARIMKLKEEI
jgi:beta-N-acetylhexosaminidase